jgi:glucokinase
MNPALVFDLGGTHLRSALSDGGELRGEVKTGRICNFLNADGRDVWGAIVASMVKTEREHHTALTPEAPIVLSFPGPIGERRKILSAPTVIGAQNHIPDIAAQVELLTQRKVHILNDISAAAWHVSAHAEQDRFLVVTVSSGVGSKICDGRHPRRVLDDVPYGGEIGHVKIDDFYSQLPCDCGGRGHVGGISSGRGIERIARIEAGGDRASFDTSACSLQWHAAPDELDNEKHIVPALLRRDPWTEQLVSRCSRPLAKAILAVVAAAGIKKVVVIGGFALSGGEVYSEILTKLLVELCDYPVLKGHVHELLQMGDPLACLKGAATYAHLAANGAV